ncbi:MAG: transporter substrate-binding domain-containing protein [Gammaproteobacteria bacterium]|nr:transporter substrate-binding domain-containing protein [Gammaproteobacteria bacterium]
MRGEQIPIFNMKKHWIKKGVAILTLLGAMTTGYASAASDPTPLLVGTTGDYPPLTVYHPDSLKFSGSEIHLIEAFAKDNHRKIEFVHTTWPTLSADLAQGKFQMAVGGISNTPDRARQFLLSEPLSHFGKVALVRCGEQEKYDTLQKIDRYPTRVIENRGGTNEQFAHDHIRHTTLIIVPKAHLVFDYLNNGWADVMFTDSTEAVYRQQLPIGLWTDNTTPLPVTTI